MSVDSPTPHIESVQEILNAVFDKANRRIKTDSSAQMVFSNDQTTNLNGSNTVFTTTDPYVAGSPQVYVNSVRLRKDTDYNETGSGTTITLINDYVTPNPPNSSNDDWMVIDYIKS